MPPDDSTLLFHDGISLAIDECGAGQFCADIRSDRGKQVFMMSSS